MKLQAGALTVSLVLLLSTGMAHAAAHVVVLPVVVGGGQEPAPELVAGLVGGLRDNPQWRVDEPAAVAAASNPAEAIKDDALAPLAQRVDEAAKRLATAPAEAAPVFESVRSELRTLSTNAPLTKAAGDLYYRASALLVAALAAANQPDRAKTFANEAALFFPGRTPADVPNLPPAAAALLAAPSGGVKLTLKSRPDGCELFLNGASVGRAPAEVQALAGATYWTHAVCPGSPGAAPVAGSPGAAAPGAAPVAGSPGAASAAAPTTPPPGAGAPPTPRKFTIGPKETARHELLDAEFDRMLAAEGRVRFRFASAEERRRLEDSYARRLAERTGADIVVLASVGELSGADWLNGRLYLRSGYLNRQGLVRLQGSRATKLGQYLATGKQTDEVLRPEEAGQMVAASQAAGGGAGPQAVRRAPWYSDAVGWTFAGVGATGLVLGLWANSTGEARQTKGDKVRGDSQTQERLWREAQRLKFYGDIGRIGGGLMLVTGAVLLAVPEYSEGGSELFVLAPRPGGATVGLSGRF